MSRASLAELEAVATVARAGGFRAAARELGVSSSALSHSIAALEDRLHVRLFNRTTRSVALTAAGETFVAEVAPALALINGALENASEGSSEISGMLRINTSRGAAEMLLEPLFLQYLRRYPRVELEIATEEALIDVLGQGFDAGVRLADTVPPDMIAVPILPTIRSVVVGAPAYFVGRKRPLVPTDLMRHPVHPGPDGHRKALPLGIREAPPAASAEVGPFSTHRSHSLSDDQQPASFALPGSPMISCGDKQAVGGP
jgi:DNA-binding transcriptional LysR family regulator